MVELEAQMNKHQMLSSVLQHMQDKQIHSTTEAIQMHMNTTDDAVLLQESTHSHLT